MSLEDVPRTARAALSPGRWLQRCAWASCCSLILEEHSGTVGDGERPTPRARRPVQRQNQHVLALPCFAQALLRGYRGGAGEPHRCHQRGDAVVVLVVGSSKEKTTALKALLPRGG